MPISSRNIPEDFGLGKSYDEIIAILKESFGVANGHPLRKLFGFPISVVKKKDDYARVYAIRGHIAAATGDVARLQIFMNETSDINTTTRDGIETKMPWIQAAVLGGQPDTLKLLLDREASVTAKYEAEDAQSAEPIRSLAVAHWTAKWPERFDVILNMLLSHGAQIDALDGHDATPLGLALSSKRLFNAEALLRGGADPSKDITFYVRILYLCFDHAFAARGVYRDRPDYADALRNPQILSKPGIETENAKQLIHIAGLAVKSTNDDLFKANLIQQTCRNTFLWPQPYLAVSQAMIKAEPSLATLGLETVCSIVQSAWSEYRDVVKLEALCGLLEGLVEMLHPADRSAAAIQARNLLATVVPTQYRIVFSYIGSFSLFRLRQYCGLYESRTIEVDVTTPLWKLEDVMRQTFPALWNRHVIFRVENGPILDDPKQRNVSLLAHKFRDNGVVFVTSANRPPIETVSIEIAAL